MPRARVSPGARYMAIAAFWFSLMSLGVKLLGTRLPNQEVVGVRGVVTLAFTVAMLHRAGVRPWGTRRGLLLGRGLIGFAALSCFYYALVHLPLADATVIQYTNPVFTALLAAWLLEERLGRRESLLVLLSLFGVVLVARPEFLFGSATAGLNPLAAGVALLGALCSAGAYVAVRALGATEDTLTIVFWFAAVTVVASLPGALAGAVLPTGGEWLLLLGVGAAAQAGQVYLTHGLREERAGRATAVAYLQIVFAALWGMIFFREVPDAWTAAGAALILASTWTLARRRAPGDDQTLKPEEVLA